MRHLMVLLIGIMIVVASSGAAYSTTHTLNETFSISDTDIHITLGGFDEFSLEIFFNPQISINPGDTIEANIDFVNGKYIELRDATSSEGLIDERFSWIAALSTAIAGTVDYSLEFTGETGDLLVSNPYIETGGDIDHYLTSVDLTDTSFLFHDLHLIAQLNPISTPTLDYVQIIFQADDIRIGTDAVPEPSTILLLGFGLAGVGLFRRN